MKNARINTSIIQLKINIKTICKEKGIKIEKLCKSLGKERNHINQLKDPKLTTIINIANAICCSPSELLNGL